MIWLSRLVRSMVVSLFIERIGVKAKKTASREYIRAHGPMSRAGGFSPPLEGVTLNAEGICRRAHRRSSAGISHSLTRIDQR
jgi:hypothetical protein